MSKSNTWLNDCAQNVNSQYGEDGILEKALEVIGSNDKCCVEFGAWDGKYYSNTYNLLHNLGYTGILIEGDESRYQDLLKEADKNTNIRPVCAYVGFTPEDNLDTLLEKHNIPLDYDLLSIDIDGNDYHVWETTTRYRPKLVIIEYNPTIANDVSFVQEKNMAISQGSSIRALAELAKKKDYELISTTLLNAIFVDNKYFPLFEVNDNRVETLRTDNTYVTYIFNGYDGTVFVRGYGKMGWHHLPYVEKRMQLLPRWLRQFPGYYGPVKKQVAKAYRSLKKRGMIF